MDLMLVARKSQITSRPGFSHTAEEEGDGGEEEGWSKREGSGWGVICTRNRVWGRAGVLTERRGRWRG